VKITSFAGHEFGESDRPESSLYEPAEQKTRCKIQHSHLYAKQAQGNKEHNYELKIYLLTTISSYDLSVSITSPITTIISIFVTLFIGLGLGELPFFRFRF
jgi:hypothetical protein